MYSRSGSSGPRRQTHWCLREVILDSLQGSGHGSRPIQSVDPLLSFSVGRMDFPSQVGDEPPE